MKAKKLLSPNIHLDLSNLITKVLKQHWALPTRRACDSTNMIPTHRWQHHQGLRLVQEEEYMPNFEHFCEKHTILIYSNKNQCKWKCVNLSGLYDSFNE